MVITTHELLFGGERLEFENSVSHQWNVHGIDVAENVDLFTQGMRMCMFK